MKHAFGTRLKVGFMMVLTAIAMLMAMHKHLPSISAHEFVSMFNVLVFGLYSIGMAALADGFCKAYRNRRA